MEINSLLYFSQYFSTKVSSVFAFNPDRKTCFSIAHQAGFLSDNLAIPEQVHSTGIKWVESPGEYSGMDGLITSNIGLILTLKVADCVPVYFFDPQSKIIGSVHSGWRGTVDGIIFNAIKLMQQKGAEIQKILVYLGPSIGLCCYEVGVEVAKSFNVDAKLKLDNQKWNGDLHKQISFQLIESGILPINIYCSDICTFDSQECHSYRRDGLNTGRMYAFIGMK